MKLKTIEEVLNLAEYLNEIVNENVKIQVFVEGIESDADIKKLTIQEKGHWFDPSQEIPCFWGSVSLGNHNFIIKGKSKEIKIIY